MEDFIYMLFRGIVKHPDKVSVEVSEPAGSGPVTYLVSVDESDMGRVIGKSGRMVRSIKTLFKAAASKQGVNAMLEVK